MTALLKREDVPTAPWNVMPGWGVVADLTPPELIEMRRLRVLRKIIVSGLVLVLVLCAIGYVVALSKESSAEDSLSDTQLQGAALARSSNKYGTVQRIQATTAGIDGQIAQLMTTDVDAARLLTDLRTALPATMSVSSVNLSLNAATDPAAGSGTTTTTPTATEAPVGTVTLSGSSKKLADLAGYVVALQRLRGVTDVLPGSNTAGAKGTATWTLTLTLTKARYSHRFDLTPTKAGGN